jgi:iron complex outermembrane receptor protein
LSFRRELSDELDLSANLYYDCASLDRDYLYNFPPRVLNRESRQGEWCGAEAQVNWRLWDKHLLTVGGEYRNDFRQDRRNYDVEPYVEYARVHRDTFNYGIYVQGDVAFRTNLHLNAGARYDQYGKLDPTANPRVALIYNPLQASTLKAIYGTAFRAPNFLERIDPRFVDLDPETITTYELAWEQGIGNRWRAALAGFYNQIDDLITLVPGVGYRNLEGAEAKGLEAELEGLLASGLRCRLSYSFQQTEDRATGRTLSDSPEHLGKFNLSVPVLKDKLFASLELQYTSSRLTLAGTTADGFGLVNLTLLSQQLIKGVEASVSLYNVLDQRYGDPATPGHLQEVLERDGRTVRFKLTYRF